MGSSKAEKSASRDRILGVAGRRFREKGFDGVGVADLMREAGLTHGGFYRHFPSRDDLIAAGAERAFDDAETHLASLMQAETLEAFLDAYLTESHRDGPSDGCAVAALATDVSRVPSGRGVFTARFQEYAERIGRMAGRTGEDGRAHGAAIIAAVAGAISIARAIEDPALATAILTASRELILASTARQEVEIGKRRSEASSHDTKAGVRAAIKNRGK